VLALGTGALVFVLLRNAVPVTDSPATLPPTAVPTKRLPVAARQLPAGTTISDTDITTQEFPLELPVTGVITQSEELLGQQVVENIEQGGFIREDQIRGGTGPISEQITQGRVLLAYPVADLLNQTRVVRDGDRVDLLITLDVTEESATETRQGKVTNITLQNVLIFRIVRDAPTEENPNPPPSAILFELEPQDAVIAKFIKDNGGVIDFTLRSPLDTDEFTTESINQDYLFDNYGFRAPRSSSRPRQQ
jgi:pilus assembly protein CpaB